MAPKRESPSALVDEGVPKSDIVLAFHSQQVREHTEYGAE